MDQTLGAYTMLACQRAMDDAGVTPDQIDGVICCQSHIAGVAAAVEAVSGNGTRAFLSVGRQDLSAFAGLESIWFLVRSIEALEVPRPLANCAVIQGRGPFSETAELALLEEHRIDLLVSKNSGGEATSAKIAAARRLGLPVVMIARPPAPAGETVETVDEAVAWVAART